MIIRLMIWVLLIPMNLYSQIIKLDEGRLEAINVAASIKTVIGKVRVEVLDSSIKAFDKPTFAKIKGFEFKNGTIEIYVLSKLLPNAPGLSAGSIGIAFRIDDSNSKFECIYVSPAKGRDTIQARRNQAVQYFSMPDNTYKRHGKEVPGQYESYADMGLNEWIKLKIVVKDARAKVFLNDVKQPSLVVNDLKNGTGSFGAIGLWVDVGTEGFFRDLEVYK